MKYVCSFCGLVSENVERAQECEAQGSTARYKVKEEVIFACSILGVRTEIKGVIKTVVHKLRTHKVTYRIFVGNDARLRHQNCIYGGIPDERVLRTL